MAQIIVRIDKQEKPAKYRQAVLDSFPPGVGVIESLSAGDYWYEAPSGLLVVERKKVNDLISTIVTKAKSGKSRLAMQMDKCVELGGRVVLLIEGQVKPIVDPAWCTADGRLRKYPYLALQAVLLGVQKLWPVDILTTDSTTATILTLRGLYDYVKKPLHGSWIGGTQ